MPIKASNNPLPDNPDVYTEKLDRGGYTGTAQTLKNDIDNIAIPDKFLTIGNIQKVGNKITIDANEFSWQLNKNIFQNNDFETTIAPASNEFSNRLDIIVANQFSNFVKIQGEESSGSDSAQEPTTPEGTLKLSTIVISGSTIGEPEHPISGDEFISKESKNFIRMFYSGAVDYVTINDRSYLKFEQGMTSLNSLSIPNSQDFYFGKSYIIKNGTTGNVTLFHNQGSGNFKFNFPNAQNIILKSEESIQIVMRAINSTNNGGLLDYVGIYISSSDNVPEGVVNLYFSTAKVLATVLTGVSFLIGGPVLPTDSILVAIGKIQKSLTDGFTASNIRSILGITTLSGSNTGDQDLSSLQVKDTKFYIGSSANVANAWSGCTVYFTASCTISVPATLSASFEEFAWRTMPGVSITWGITTPFIWETTPLTTPEKTDGLFTRYNGGNTIINRW